MSWKLAGSLVTLRDQIDDLAPKRSKASDGTIGDAAHRSRPSDHNPNAAGYVTAMDITHDPKNDMDCNLLADSLVKSKDRRIKYIIWNSRIWTDWDKKWVAYGGSNPHTKHLHLSVDENYNKKDEWSIDMGYTLYKSYEDFKEDLKFIFAGESLAGWYTQWKEKYSEWKVRNFLRQVAKTQRKNVILRTKQRDEANKALETAQKKLTELASNDEADAKKIQKLQEDLHKAQTKIAKLEDKIEEQPQKSPWERFVDWLEKVINA